MDFEAVYREYFGDVFRYLHRLTGSEELADELTAETFFKALRSIDRFRGECELRVWLLKIAKNAFYSHENKNRRISSVGEEPLYSLPDTGSDPAGLAERRAELNELRQILHTLKEPYKEVFMWRAFGELSFREIGQIFGKTENWACVTFHRARKMLIERSKGE